MSDELLHRRLLMAARRSLWARLRLVVIDLETCVPPERGPQRVVSAAAVTCRHAAALGSWSAYVNPQCPIDPFTKGIHGITDELVATEPNFDVIAPQLATLLESRAGERVVLVAHNVGSDVSVLRAEYGRAGLDLPDVEVLDTMGRLPRLVEVRTPDGSLAALADTLGIVNPHPHQALADAQTCASAVIELLERAAQRGMDDFDQLLAEVSRGATTATVKAAKRSGSASHAAAERPRVIDPDHTETHREVLGARVREAGLLRWGEQVAECCRLRCPGVLERVEQAEPDRRKLLGVLDVVLNELAADGDGPGVATLLPALLPLVEHLEPRKGRHGVREAVLAWAGRRAKALDGLERCDKDRCPACENRQPCPLDTWREPLAPLVIGDLDTRARSFLKPNGSEAGTGAYTTWMRRRLDREVADAALALVVQHWRDKDQQGWADTVARFGWDAGCRHPDVAEAVAVILAAPGGVGDLEAAVATIDTALATANGSTAPGWPRLMARRGQLAGLLYRATTGRPTGEFDEDGNPVYAAPHHPAQPRRTRPRRFVEGPAAPGP